MNKIPVFFSTDDAYAPLATTAMASVLFNTKSFIEFYILDAGLSEINIRKIEMLKEKFNNFSLEFIKVNVMEKFGDIKLRNYPSLTAFARFMIPELKPEIDKIVYLDCDTIVLKDIAELYNTELNGHIIGAVTDPGLQENAAKKQQRYAGALLSNEHLYFNSGVMLIDCNKWRENNTFDKLMIAERETTNTRMFNDQDVLNKAFDSNYQPLNIKFNVKSDVLEYCDINDMVVRHFTGWIKPWTKSGFIQANSTDFWFYAQMTSFFAEMMVRAITEMGVISIGELRKI